MNHTIDNVTAQEGTFSFTARSTDAASGKFAERELTLPLPEGDVPSIPALTDLAMNYVNGGSLFTQLDGEVLTALTPIYTPPPPPEPPSLEEQKAAYMNQVDSRVAYILSTFTRFQIEYEAREKAAMNYKAAGYTGDPTSWITVFADNTGMTYQAATDLILQQSEQLRTALMNLANARMEKYKIQSAPTAEAAEQQLTIIWDKITQIEENLP